MRSLFALPSRTTEGIAENVAALGGSLGSFGRDPIDGDSGYRLASRGSRDVPYWTREKSRDYSVTAYWFNPMATAVVDTYVAFAVGDSGVNWQATNEDVATVVREFWDDPAVRMGELQEPNLRSQLLLGEQLYEMMQGSRSGVIRYCPYDPALIKDVLLRSGNPMWPERVVLPPKGEGQDDWRPKVVQVNDKTGLREGQVMFWTPWKRLNTETRGMPFLTPILDWLDNYDTVLSNLIDRTTLMRHMSYFVEMTGASQAQIDKWVLDRGGKHVPASGTIEVGNESVKWHPISGQTGAAEDTAANAAVLTNIASGAGLAKTWLAEPDGANRATSMSMAEPVRRRVASVQKVWLGQQTEMVRFVVDRAVAAGRLPATVEAKDPRTGATMQIPASQAVTITGPEIAAADSQITAQTMLNMATAVEKLVGMKLLSVEAGSMLARKAWEDFAGVPYTAELNSDSNPDDLAELVEKNTDEAAKLRLVGGKR